MHSGLLIGIDDPLRPCLAIANSLSCVNLRTIHDLQVIISHALRFDLGIDLGFDLVAISGQGDRYANPAWLICV
jgi:hypothetical protein